MEYRQLGRTGLELSVVGFGTAQLRLIPEKRAIETLLKGFDLGVNLVHAAPDYGTAEEIVARAVRLIDRKVIVATQGFDVAGGRHRPVSLFERLFETACERFGDSGRLDLFGIACIDGREANDENVWGARGMVEFLQDMKAQGRLRASFCTTHGSPDDIARVVTSGAFDAVMLPYNPLGHHLLTYPRPAGCETESLGRNGRDILPLCRHHGVGVMVMKPLAGGLLCRGQALRSRHNWGSLFGRSTPAGFLRSILLHPEVTCVLPGTSSPDEALQNALAGYEPIELEAGARAELRGVVADLRKAVCSRCGACDRTCRENLPLSLIFWAGLLHLHPAAAFEPIEGVEYFRLHPRLECECATCPNPTCACPSGIDIPRNLQNIHALMLDLLARDLIPPPAESRPPVHGDSAFGARIISCEIPDQVEPGEASCCLLQLENAGDTPWRAAGTDGARGVALAVSVNHDRVRTIDVPQDVAKGGRWQLSFEVAAPPRASCFRLRLQLLGDRPGPILLSKVIRVDPASWTDALLTAVRVRNRDLSGPSWSPLGSMFGDRAERPKGDDEEDRGRWVIARVAPPSADRDTVALDEWLSLEPPTPEPPAPSKTDSPTAVADEPIPVEEEGEPEAAVGPKLYDVGWLEHNIPASYPRGETCQIYLRVENRGSRPWRASHPDGQWVEVVVYLGDVLHRSARLPHDVAPGQNTVLGIPVTFPEETPNGSWTLTVSFVEQNVAWFHLEGADPLVVEVRAREPESGPIAAANSIVRQSNWGAWQPSGGVLRSRAGELYPMFVERARGARFEDAEGHQWIDYVMAGGAAILGYAHPEIQEAVSRHLASSAVLTLPHSLEATVTRTLRERFPGAEMVLFGKHGSDACTAAVRIARLRTGRRVILHSGYHGWHDWYAETLQPRLANPDAPASVHAFPLNDAASFDRLIEEHAGEIAAVMLEPAAQAGNMDDAPCEADAGFLRHVKAVCREQQCLLIFDEIITGFRYPGGSVQEATGVVPDLTCLGKALSAGMPLSALVGSRDAMSASVEAMYVPTFRGEMYSLAAAEAALRIHRSRDVPAEIARFGTALKDAVNALSRELGVAGGMIGVPFRLIYRFDEPDPDVRVLKRTLLQQELLRRGVLTFKGFMLPSLAHGEKELDETVSAFWGALLQVQEAASGGAFVQRLEIPWF